MLKNVKNRIIPTILVIIFSFTFYLIPASAKTKEVIVGGDAFGLKIYCKGVMVTKFESFISDNKKICPAKVSGIKKGDIILSVNNRTVKNNEQLENAIKESKGRIINLTIQRNKKILYYKIKPETDSENNYHIGLWIKDSCAGIGTITYYDNKKKTYGALGHGICDIGSKKIIPSGKGEIIKAKITDIKKSSNNNIGTLNGIFTNKTLGDIKNNSPIGIYGKLYSKIKNKSKINVAEKYEIKPGSAKLITTLNGEAPKSYNIDVLGICNNSEKSNKNFIIRIKDKELIKSTGGIVQGMSGSPIIQNNKLIGALTHVFLDDCKKGYGIFAENMIDY